MRLVLPVEPRFTFPDPRIDAIRGTVAVERGPEVFCLESVDLPPGVHVDELLVDTAVAPREASPREIAVSGFVEDRPDPPWPYRSENEPAAGSPIEAVLHPYHDWANRGPVSMRIWLRKA